MNRFNLIQFSLNSISLTHRIYYITLYLIFLSLLNSCGPSFPPPPTPLPTLAQPALLLSPLAQSVPLPLPQLTISFLPTIAQLAIVPSITPTPLPTIAQLAIVPSPTATATPPHTPTPTATATAHPLEPYTINYLMKKSYGGGEINLLTPLWQTDQFTRYSISYPSDGLTIAGFADIPHQRNTNQTPFVIILHGYMPVTNYQTETYTQRYAATFAQAGFITIHPNFRNHPPSDTGPNLFRTGYAIDVLNLVALLQTHSFPANSPFADGDSSQIHLFGHSMGGGIALRVITVNPTIKSAVLYAAMSGDELRNFSKINEWSYGLRGQAEQGYTAPMLEAVSPLYFLDQIETKVAIHHSPDDELVPFAWSDELCTLLKKQSVPTTCFFDYSGYPHTFYGMADQLLLERSINFFKQP